MVYDNKENNKIREHIYNVYRSDNDITDLSKIVFIISNNIIENLDNPSIDLTQKYENHYSMMKLRLFAKKLLCLKARQGHDFHNKDLTSMCKQNEKPRWFINVHECKSQYNDFIINVWKPTTVTIKNKYMSYFENFENQIVTCCIAA